MARVAQLPANDRAPPRKRLPLRRSRRRKLKYHAFLSYSHKDEAIADWLHEELEAFRVPAALVGRLAENGPIPRRLTPIFRDEHELAAADDLGDEIEAALASAQVLIVLCSPHAASSHWTNAEIETFKKSRPEGCILAAIASGEPFASDIKGREDEECFPPALREKYDRRGRPTGKRAEPLAADLRDSGDGRRMGFLKLVAGILGVGLDELVQRETIQRHRRLAWLTAASLAGMAVTSGLALTAIQARDSARDQRREAEGLVAFMLGDLKDKLEPIGKLDALDGVGTKVLEYYRGQNTSELSDAGLMQRSQALSLSAQVAYLHGNFESAQKLYREAMQGTAEAIRRSPGDPQRLFDHAQNVFYFGAMAAERGELRQAESAFRNYDALAKQMTSLQPDSLRWKMEGQYAHTNLGVILLRQRRFDNASRQFSAALTTIQAVAAVEPSNVEYQKSLAESLAWLADAELARGDLRGSIASRQRQISVLKALAASGSDVEYQQKLIPAYQSLGWLFAVAGQQAQAEEYLQSAVTTAERLLPAEPNNSKWVDFAARSHLALAQHQISIGSTAKASSHLAKGCSYAASLRRPGEATAWRMARWACIDRQAQIALAEGQADRAAGLAEQSVALAKGTKSGDPIADRALVAKSLTLAGDAYRSLNQPARARQAWSQAIQLMPTGNRHPGERAILIDLLERTGQRGQASQLRAELAARGFRNLEILKSAAGV